MQKPKYTRSMEWLKLPLKTQKKFTKNLISISVDYLQYTCYDISTTLRSFFNDFGFTGEIDTDNSNVMYNHDYSLSLVRGMTRKGSRYLLNVSIPGFAPIPILSLEIYEESHVKLLKTEGKLVFYGAYFVFIPILKEDYPYIVKFQEMVESHTRIQFTTKGFLYKRTRVDIALDIAQPIDQKWNRGYIIPHKTSKHVPRQFNYVPDLGGHQSFSYLSKRGGKGIGIRVYNKIIDIKDKKKEPWYPEYGPGKKYPNVMRIEIVYGDPYSTSPISELIEHAKSQFLYGYDKFSIGVSVRPKSVYSSYKAYEYIKKYAKNHGMTLDQLILDISREHFAHERIRDMSPMTKAELKSLQFC